MVFIVNMYAAGIATGFGDLAMDFRADNAQLTNLISYPVLALGAGNVFWTPTAVCLGKRPTVIAAMLVFLAGSIWSIKATSLNSLIASRVIASFAGGSIDSLGPAVVGDLYMERYFATSMAIFAFSLSGGSQFGPMIAGFLITAKGWRWFFILCTILIAVNFVTVLFFFPETNYRRVLYDDATAEEADKQAAQMIEYRSGKEGNNVTSSSDVDLNPEYAGSYWKDLVNFKDRGVEPKGILAWPKQFSLPFRFLLVPHVLFATVSYGVFLGGVVMISTFTPSILFAPPYLLKASGVGLFSLASFAGIVIAYPIAGPLTDWLSHALRRRNQSEVHNPEDRIPALIVPFIIAPPGLILLGYILHEQRSVYIAGVGNAMQAAALVLVPSSVMSVVIDGWPASGSEALVLINAGKNAVAFGLTLSTPKWLAGEGLVKMCWEMAGIQWAVLALGSILYFWGPWLRKKTMWLI